VRIEIASIEADLHTGAARRRTVPLRRELGTEID
jgi:hypothetical protein